MIAVYQIILIALVSFLGVILGGVIANYTKEELKTGEKYFRLLCLLLLGVIITALFYNVLLIGVKTVFYFSIILLIGAITGLYIRIKYFYFGLALALAAISEKSFLLIASLIFLFGLPYGSLEFLAKQFRKEAINCAILFFTAFFLVYIGNFLVSLTGNISYLFAFVTGNLFGIIAKVKLY